MPIKWCCHIWRQFEIAMKSAAVWSGVVWGVQWHVACNAINWRGQHKSPLVLAGFVASSIILPQIDYYNLLTDAGERSEQQTVREREGGRERMRGRGRRIERYICGQPFVSDGCISYASCCWRTATATSTATTATTTACKPSLHFHGNCCSCNVAQLQQFFYFCVHSHCLSTCCCCCFRAKS